MGASDVGLFFITAQPPLIINGAPSLLIDDMPIAWEVVEQTETVLRLHAPAPLPDGFGWSLAEWDPAVRSVLGGFLQPSHGAVESPKSRVLTASLASTSTVAITIEAGPAFWVSSYRGGLSWATSAPTIQETGEPALDIAWTGPTTGVLTFGSGELESGYHLVIPSPDVLFGPEGFYVPPDNYPIP